MKRALLIRANAFLLAAAALLAALPALATNLPVGGGLLDSGLQGSYYANPDLSGSPLFQRRDIRLDFDWGTLRKHGGSLAWTRLGQLGADNYSIRWEGGLMARFSETYTLKVFADSARVWIKTSGSDWGAPLIDYWPSSEPSSYLPQTATYAFTAGQRYDIRIEYRERTGPAMMRLLWSSPSTPEEVIQPTAMVGEIPPTRSVVYADAVLGASNWTENNPTALRDGVLTLGPDGWPAEDFGFLIRPQNAQINPGTYLLTFNGWAKARVNLASGVQFYSADGSTLFGSTTNGTQGYNPATNTTTLRVVIPPGNGNCWPAFSETDRDGPSGTAYGTYSGLTNVRMLKPTTQFGSTPHDPDELFDRNALATLETFVTFRWNDVNGTTDANGTSIGEWAHRRPWGPNITGPNYTGENHEYKILLSNHTGRDLYIQVPHVATDDYIRKLAQLIRYGADASGNPYTSDQADPVFPPLNPNLRVIVEYSNETPWNTAGQYPQGAYMQNMPSVLRSAWLADPNSPDGRRFAAINFDGVMSTDPAINISSLANGSRYFALRTVEISNIFREVFGDDAMPAPGKHDPRVRPVLMYQYDNYNNTATNALTFIDRYFFKTDPASTFTGTPRPVSWYLYGGGAATYYASADRYGIETLNPLTADGLGTFETPQLAPGEARVAPPGSPWTFTGTAGIYREAARTAGTLGAIPSTTTSVDAFNYRGMKITVGPQDVAIYEIGRYVHPGNTSTLGYAIYDADSPHTTRLTTTWSPAGFPSGQVACRRTGQNVYIISNKAYSWPVILQAGKSYYIVAQEANGTAHALDVPITPPPGITIDGSASGSLVNGTWTWQVGATPNRTHGPLNIKVATLPHTTNTGVTLGFLNDSKDGLESITSFNERYFSPQAAFIAGNGSMEIEVTFPAPGIYGLIYHLAHKRDQTPYDATADNWENRPLIHLIEDGNLRNITPSSQGSQYPSASGWSHESYWTKPNTGYDFFGSVPFEITDASKTYRIRFSGTATTTARVVCIDNIHIASAAKMTEGQIPSGGGFAEGAPDVSNWEARVMSMYKYPQAFGLKAISYEGGWYPGGDANKMPLQFASSFFAAAMLQGESNAIRALQRVGLAVNTDYTLEFAMPEEGIYQPEAFRRIQAWRSINASLPSEPTNGQPLNSIFTASNAWLSRSVSGATLQPGGWFAWNAICPQSGNYTLHLETTGNGTVSVRVNDAIVALTGAAGGVLSSAEPVYLTKGLHTLRLLASDGSPALVSLSVSQPGQPAGFTGLTASPGFAEAFLRWNAVPGATGYHVYFKSRLDSTFTRYTTTPITDTSIFVGGLQNGTTYQFVVTYLNSSGVESAYSNQASTVPEENPPLLAWEFDDSTTKTSGNLPATTVSGALAGIPTFIAGTGRAISTNSFINVDAVGYYFLVPSTPSTDSLHPDVYLQFSVTPAAGKILRLTQLNFGLWHSSGANATLQAQLRVSTDNFATYTVVPLSPDPATVPSGNFGATTGRLITADLSGVPALRNLPAGATATFRIHIWGPGIGYGGIGKLGVSANDVVLYGYPVAPNTVETPVASPAEGIYAAPLTVTLSTLTSGAQIRYTTDGSAPSETNGALIAASSGNLTLNATTTLRAIAFKAGMNPSAILSRTYTIAATTIAPQFSPPGGVYNTPQTIQITSPTSRATIRYTTDGSTPTTTNGTLYTGPFPISDATTLRAIAYRSDLVPSAVSTASYMFSSNSPPQVANPIPDQQALIGSPFLFQVPANTFTDAEDPTLTLTASLADNSPLPAWLSFDTANGTFSGTPGPDDLGALHIKLTAADSGALSVSDEFTLAIAPPPAVVYLDNNFDAVPAGNYNGTAGAAFGANATLGNASGAFTSTVNATGGVANSARVTANDLAVRSRNTFDIRADKIRFTAWFLFNPASATLTGGFLGVGYALPAGADGVNTYNAGSASKLLIGLSRTSSANNTVRLDGMGAFNSTSALPGSTGDILTANLTPGRWYQFNVTLKFNHNAATPANSTLTVENLEVRDRGTDGLLEGGSVLRLASATFNPGFGNNLDTNHAAYAFFCANRDRGTNTLDRLLVQTVPPFSFWTLAYHPNSATSGTVPIAPSQHLNNSTITAAANTGNLSRAGFTFNGWNTAADGSGTAYLPGATFSMPAADLTLYAQWQPLPPYEAWVTSQPELAALPAPDRQPLADPDGDGVPNLLEFAFGGTPTNPASRPLPAIGTTEVSGQHRLTLTFTPQQVTGLRYVVQASTDLSDWADQSDLTDQLVVGQLFTLTDSGDLSAPRRFLRLHVSLEP